MVSFALSERSDLIGKIHRLDEIMKSVLFYDRASVFAGRPSLYIFKHRDYLALIKSFRPHFTGHALFLCEIHVDTLPCVKIWCVDMLRRVRSVLETALDTVLPLRPRSARTKALSLEKIPLSVTAHSLLDQEISTLMDYRRAEVRDLIQSLKYDGTGYAAHLCAAVLSEYLSEEIASARMFSQKRIVLIPIPLHTSRERERGFNQIALVLNALPSEYRDGRAALVSHALERIRRTTPQTRLSRAERLRNLEGAFCVTDPALVQNTHVYLIDDVTTTGSTLTQAASALKRAGADVSLIALARA